VCALNDLDAWRQAKKWWGSIGRSGYNMLDHIHVCHPKPWRQMCASHTAVAHIVQSVYREQSTRCVPPKALEFEVWRWHTSCSQFIENRVHDVCHPRPWNSTVAHIVQSVMTEPCRRSAFGQGLPH
jgi:hypothetical protein